MGRESLERLWRTVKNSSISLPFGVLDVAAGFLVTNILYLLSENPILLTIYPMLLTGRGIINGILSGNISTLLHTGVVKPSIRGNTGEFYNLLSSIFLLSIFTGIYIGFLAVIPNTIFGYVNIRGLILGVSTAFHTVLISVYINMPITLYLASKSFKSALDPDIIVYPIMSTLADLLLSLIYVSVSLFVYYIYLLQPTLIFILSIVIGLPSLIHLYRYGLGIFGRDLIRESIVVILVLVGLSTLTGGILSGLMDRIIENPLILIIYPAFATLMGDIGAIIGSIATTRIQIGDIEPRLGEVYRLFPEIAGVEAVALIMITVSNILAYTLARPGLDRFIITLSGFYIANIMLLPILILLSISSAFITFRRGLNPDNFVIPVETTIMDFLTAGAIITILNIIS